MWDSQRVDLSVSVMLHLSFVMDNVQLYFAEFSRLDNNAWIFTPVIAEQNISGTDCFLSLNEVRQLWLQVVLVHFRPGMRTLRIFQKSKLFL